MKFFLALLASQQTLAESGVDSSCVAEEVSLLQSRHSAAKDNETVHPGTWEWSPRPGTFYLSAPGAPMCTGGYLVSKKKCNRAVRSLIPYTPPNVRGRQTCTRGSCLRDPGWRQVPNGCSVQSGGDWAAHFKKPQQLTYVSPHYQLVCTVPQGWPEAPFYWAPYHQKTCNGGDTVSAFACAAAVRYLNGGATMGPLAYDGNNGGGQSHQSCNGPGWGKVPTGCSAQTAGDGRPHFREELDDGLRCASNMYQLVCTTRQP